MQHQAVVLITGCSSGIGRAIALEYHQRGYHVYATARQVSALTELAAQGLDIARLDVTDAAAIERLIAQIVDQTGRIDILVNNAGYAVISPLLDVPQAELDQQLRTNVSAPLTLIQAVVPSMIERGEGLIVNIGSVSGVLVTPFAGAYCASKAALHAISDALRMELAPFNIKVVLVQPGAIQSHIGEAARQRLEQLLPSVSRYQPLLAFIRARTVASQQQATPTAEFARQLVDRLSQSRIPSVMPLGNRSRWYLFLGRWLPRWARDRILSSKYGLNRLTLP